MGGDGAMTWNLFSFECQRCEAFYEIAAKADTYRNPICCSVETILVNKKDVLAEL
jgi:hypothetical protein